ncbi:hypothetical protein FIU91_14710 [Roseivivax sp. THAF30]|nr:hypothetical protein FIU91_14710 [Roseivivax sp. THAF30]
MRFRAWLIFSLTMRGLAAFAIKHFSALNAAPPDQMQKSSVALPFLVEMAVDLFGQGLAHALDGLQVGEVRAADRLGRAEM